MSGLLESQTQKRLTQRTVITRDFAVWTTRLERIPTNAADCLILYGPLPRPHSVPVCEPYNELTVTRIQIYFINTLYFHLHDGRFWSTISRNRRKDFFPQKVPKNVAKLHRRRESVEVRCRKMSFDEASADEAFTVSDQVIMRERCLDFPCSNDFVRHKRSAWPCPWEARALGLRTMLSDGSLWWKTWKRTRPLKWLVRVWFTLFLDTGRLLKRPRNSHFSSATGHHSNPLPSRWWVLGHDQRVQCYWRRRSRYDTNCAKTRSYTNRSDFAWSPACLRVPVRDWETETTRLATSWSLRCKHSQWQWFLSLPLELCGSESKGNGKKEHVPKRRINSLTTV